MAPLRVSLLGHATLLVEGGGARVLTDPLFFGPGERTLDPCPKRVVHLEELGPLDAIVISHRHLDHFDVESLRRLDRGTPLFVPSDAELVARARDVGFRDVRPLEPWAEARVHELRLFVTPSRRDDVAEMGMVFCDESASVWNQVDTVVTQATCVGVLERLGGALDACLCPYNPLLEHATMWVNEVDFPQARYERLIEMALCSRARLVVPGSFGLRMVGRYAHFNQRCYPVSRERFVEDLRRVAPEQAALLLSPGQGLELRRGATAERVRTPYATTLEDDTALVRFAPSSEVAPLVDPNPLRFGERELERAVEHIVGRLWPARAQELLAAPRPGPLLTLESRRAVVDLEVVFPKRRLRFRVTRWTPRVEIAQVSPTDEAYDYCFTYVASQLYALALGRPYQTPEVYAVRRREARPSGLTPVDPPRLAGVDAYETTDEGFSWSPLDILEGQRL